MKFCVVVGDYGIRRNTRPGKALCVLLKNTTSPGDKKSWR